MPNWPGRWHRRSARYVYWQRFLLCARTDRDFRAVNFQRVTVGTAQGSTQHLWKVCPLVHHRQYNAVNIQPGIDTALYG